MQTNILIVGSGAAGLFCALNLSTEYNITIITKSSVEESDSFLAQGGICMLRNEKDYDNYFEDTLKAGHYENDKKSVEIMIKSSREIISNLVDYGVEFEKDEDSFCFTREGGHSRNRILFHEDVTGKEITSKLLGRVREKSNITILENTTMLDIIESNNKCNGIVCRMNDNSTDVIYADYIVLACGGIGGLYTHSTNFRHLTGDGVAIALKHNIALKNINYVQIHPTTLYSAKPGRRFLISESVRGEGALLYNSHMKRFTDELMPRDLLTAAIHKQMAEDKKPYVWLSLAPIPTDKIINHFPNIYRHCLESGYDITKECIPVVPAQHYFMGGIKVNYSSMTSLNHLYAIGETSCNGVHGANRLASNSLLETLVFAKRAAKDISDTYSPVTDAPVTIDMSEYSDLDKLNKDYKEIVQNEIERMNKEDERNNNEAKCG